MRFVLYNKKKSSRFDVVDDADQVVFESEEYPSQEAATEAISQSIDALRSAGRYRTAENGVTLTAADGAALLQARIPAGTSTADFIDQRVEDAADQAQFRVEVNTSGKRFGTGGPPVAPTREEMTAHYDFSFASDRQTVGVVESENEAPYRFWYQDAGGDPILYSRDFPSTSRLHSGIRSLLRYAKKKYIERWEESGRYYFRVVSPQGFGLARSGGFAGEAQREAAIAYYLETASEHKPAYAKTTRKQRIDQQEYLFDRPSVSGKPGFEEFKAENKKHYFSFNDEAGVPLLLSQGYRGGKSRLTGLRSVIKNGSRPQRYRIRERKGSYYIILLAGNNAEIGRSRAFESEAEAERYRDYLLTALPTTAAAYEVDLSGSGKATAVTETSEFEITRAIPEEETEAYVPNAAREQDNYLVCSAYEDRVSDSKHPKHDDVIVFQHDNGLYYFATLDGNDAVGLRSEGYPTVGARDNGLKSVLRFREKRGRYKSEEVRGFHFTLLTAQNGQEIGRSCPKKSEDEASSLWPALGAAALAAQAAREATPAVEVAPTPEPEAYVPNAAREQDNYLVCSAYEDRVGDSKHPKHDDVIVFQHDNGLYYFATLDGKGGVGLRSEGYPTVGARDNGLKSVLRFREKRGRYKSEEVRGFHFTLLTAQNGQEIGRSCPKKSKDEASALWPALGAAALAAQAARESTPAPEVAVAPEPEAYVPNAAREQDNYLVCSAYQDRASDSKNPKHGDVIVFQHDNGLYYFATLDASDKIALRSEGYPNAGARDKGLKSVLRFREKRQRFKTEENRGLYFTVLYAQNGQEIGRSCPKKSEEAAGLLVPGLGAAAAALAAAASATVPEVETPTPEVPVAAMAPVVPPVSAEPADKEDDYLACKEYRDRKVNDKKNRVSLFKHSNGQFYFAILNEDGSIRLRSEGFRKAKERDQELSGALRFLDDESKYERITHGKYHLNVLRDETGREVGRSCATLEPAAFVPVLLAGAAAAAVPLAAATAAPVVPPPTPTPAPAPEPVPPPPSDDDRGGCAWWMWLLAALLLLGLLWFFLRGCGGEPTGDVAGVKPPAVEAPAAPTPAEEADAAVPATSLSGSGSDGMEATPTEPVDVPEPASPAPPPEPVTPAAPPAPAPVERQFGAGLSCGQISPDASYNDLGIPELPVSDFGGLAGRIQRHLQGTNSGTQTFSLADIAFLAPGNDLAVEECSVGDVDRLAAVLRNRPEATVTIRATNARDCASLSRLLRLRGVDAAQLDVEPSSENVLIVTQ